MVRAARFADNRGVISETTSSSGRRLRVQLVGPIGAASGALRAWLGERAGLHLAGPAATIAAALALATTFRPQAVVLDFHGLPVSVTRTVALFKQNRPPPHVIVLAHDASPALRRRCRDARVDAVFDRTNELDLLAAHLEQLRTSPG
jgi:DNA-binding NarL/FixJ family response regulator